MCKRAKGNRHRGLRYPSYILENRGLDDPLGFAGSLNHRLQGLDGGRREKLLAGFLIHPGRHVLDKVDLPITFQGISDSLLD